MNLKEELQQLAIADLLRIENDLDCLGVSAVFAIRRIGDITAGVPDPRGNHAGVTSYKILHTPKAAAGEHGTFGRSSHALILIRASDGNIAGERYDKLFACLHNSFM